MNNIDKSNNEMYIRLTQSHAHKNFFSFVQITLTILMSLES